MDLHRTGALIASVTCDIPHYLRSTARRVEVIPTEIHAIERN